MGRSALQCCSTLSLNQTPGHCNRPLDGYSKVASEARVSEVKDFCAFVSGWHGQVDEALKDLGESEDVVVKREAFRRYAAELGYAGDAGSVFDAMDVKRQGCLTIRDLRVQLAETNSRSSTTRTFSDDRPPESRRGSGEGRRGSKLRSQGTRSMSMDNGAASPKRGSPSTSPGQRRGSKSWASPNGDRQRARSLRVGHTDSSTGNASLDACEAAKTSPLAPMKSLMEESTRSSLHATETTASSPLTNDNGKKKRRNSKQVLHDGGAERKEDEIDSRWPSKSQAPESDSRPPSKGSAAGGRKRRSSKEVFMAERALMVTRDSAPDAAAALGGAAAPPPRRAGSAPASGRGAAAAESEALVSVDTYDGTFLVPPPDYSPGAGGPAEPPVLKAPVADADADGVDGGLRVDRSRFVFVRPLPYQRYVGDDSGQRIFVYKDQLVKVPLLPLDELNDDRERAPAGANAAAGPASDKPPARAGNWQVAKSKVVGAVGHDGVKVPAAGYALQAHGHHH